MSLWLRVRRARACVLTAVLVAAALVPFRALYVSMPDLTTGIGLVVPLSLLLPLSVSIVLVWGLAAGEPRLEAVAARQLHLLDAVYASSMAILAFALCAAAALLGGTELAYAAGRNALGYVGLALIGRRVVGPQAAAVVPVAWVIMASLFGTDLAGQPREWAWPLARPENALSWGIALGLLVIGSGVSLMSRGRMSGEW